MAVYHLHVKNLSRADGRSVVAAAAYRAAARLTNLQEAGVTDFTAKKGVLHAAILTPALAPAWMADREQLWNTVEAIERRKDARLAKEIEFALPRELTRAHWLDLAERFALHYVDQGHVVDYAVHDDGTGHNPHVHMLITTRFILPEGFGLKMRHLDRKEFVVAARRQWAALANTYLAGAGHELAIDHRSFADRGMATLPTRHRGPNIPTTQERTMRRPSYEIYPEDRRDFPLLTQREDWPPDYREPARNMTAAERDELARYWQREEAREVILRGDNPVEEAERRGAQQDMEDFIRRQARAMEERQIERQHPQEPTRSMRDVVREARDGAREVRDWLTDRNAVPEREEPLGLDPYERAFEERSEAFWQRMRDQEEVYRGAFIEELRSEGRHVSGWTPELREEYDEWRAEVDREMRERYEREPIAEPEPDPDGRAITREELDAAQERQRQELERDEPDREDR